MRARGGPTGFDALKSLIRRARCKLPNDANRMNDTNTTALFRRIRGIRAIRVIRQLISGPTAQETHGRPPPLGDELHRGPAHEDLPVKALAPGERRDVAVLVHRLLAIAGVQLLA